MNMCDGVGNIWGIAIHLRTPLGYGLLMSHRPEQGLINSHPDALNALLGYSLPSVIT